MNSPDRPPERNPLPRPSLGRNLLNGPFLWIALVLLAGVWLFSLFWQGVGQVSTIPVSYSFFTTQVNNDNVATATIDNNNNTISGTFKSAVASDVTSKASGSHFTTTIPAPNTENPVPNMLKHGVKLLGNSQSTSGSFWLGLLINLSPVVIIIAAIFWLSRRAGQTQQGIFSFGQSKARLYLGGKSKTTFADVAGVDEAKEELAEVVDFLKNPTRYQRLGGKIPKGMLLIGPPGTGKTLLARAVAGEADVPFFSMSGSEFVEMLVGVGASRVRDLFDKAKKSSPCIVFIDELDAVGRQRGAGLGGGNDEREQTLNQILVEMDGFDARQAIVVMAATNRPDVLDPALLRPGRFDRRVVVDRPDWRGREAILRVHSRGLPLRDDVDLSILARATPGMVGADLANLCNEAALLAARRNQDAIGMDSFEAALDRIMIGAVRPLLLSPAERKVIAYHEGGHALVALLTPGGDPVRKVTIIPRGQSLGVTQIMPTDDRHNYPRRYLLARIAWGLGGRVAEQVALGEVTTGAENDFQNVTNLTREMVTRWGMSNRIGTVFFGMEREVFLGRDMGMGAQREFSERTASIIDEEVQRIIANRYDFVATVLEGHRPALDRIAELLLERETLDEHDLLEIVAGLAPVDSSAWDEALFPSDAPGTAAATAAGAANGHAALPTPDAATRAADAASAAPAAPEDPARWSGQLTPDASGISGL
ncbi:MAG TPA: ATP-dependent zinc metalloprotease FtsH [Ktedonobacterales bacterium]|jgi:cell division protease FtsH